jgi:hypothetical protein
VTSGIAMSHPKNVLELAGIALSDLVVNTSAGQYVPTLHMAKFSRWNGMRIEQVRFGSYPDQGLLEIAWAEALARAWAWDSWAFGFMAGHPEERLAFLIEAGGAPLANIIRVIQEFMPPKEGFRLVGDPRFYLRVQASYSPIDAAQAILWKGLFERGINRMKLVREKLARSSRRGMS